MHIDYAAITHQGRVRKNNEDAYLISAMDGLEAHIGLGSIAEPRECPLGLLAAVADGMGGAAAGEIASREGLAALDLYVFGQWGRFPEKATEATLFRTLYEGAREASDAVIRYSETDRQVRGMGSTLTAAIFWNGSVYLCQVGDSRAYLYRGKKLVQLTRDQTLVNDLIAKGIIRPEDARHHPQRSMITQALGCPLPIEAVLGKVELRKGDRVLLCSDGLHGELSDEKILRSLSMEYSCEKSLRLLLKGALKNGGRDNITGVLLDIDDPHLPLPDPEEEILVTGPELSKNDGGMMSLIGRIFTGKS